MSDARYAEVVRWLKLAAGALAGATVALAIFNNYQASKEVVPAYEPVGTETVHRNQTIVYRQEPSPQSDARAVQVEASVYEVDDAEPYTARAVQTVRFVNPSPREIIGASAPAPSKSADSNWRPQVSSPPSPRNRANQAETNWRPQASSPPSAPEPSKSGGPKLAAAGLVTASAPEPSESADSNWQPRASSPQ